MPRRQKLIPATCPLLLLVPLLFCALPGGLSLGGCNRAESQSAAANSALLPLEYEGEWGTRGTGPGQFGVPVGLATDGAGNVYLADAASGYVNKFSRLGQPRLSYQDDRLNLQPVDVAVDSGGAIYVAEGRRGSVIIYYPDGRRYREMRIAPAKQFRRSLRVAVDEEGYLYVAGKKPFGVRRYGRRGRLEAVWASGKTSAGVAVEEPAAMAVGPDGLLYVGESARPVIHVFHPSGEWVRTFRAPQEGAQFAGIAVTSRMLVAADPKHHALHVWSVNGDYRRREELAAWITGPAPSPTNVGLSPDGECLVLDAPAARILRFRLRE